jgi:hypothetical protein
LDAALGEIKALHVQRQATNRHMRAFDALYESVSLDERLTWASVIRRQPDPNGMGCAEGATEYSLVVSGLSNLAT